MTRISGMPARAIAITTLLAISLTPFSASAVDDGKMACIDAHAASQKLRQDQHLRAARAKLVTCASEGCPGVVRKECAGWLSEVNRALPSVVLVARDEHGAEIRDVIVLVDGEPIATTLDGTSLPVDPGIRKFRFERTGSATVEQDVTIRSGERDRELTVTIPSGAPAPAATSTAPATKPPEASSAGSPVLAIVVGGVGVLALGSFGFFALDSSSKKSKLDDSGCKPNCAQSDVDAVKKDYLIANISLAVGVVGLGAATYLFLTRSKGAPSADSSAHVEMDFAPLRGGGNVGIHGNF